MEQHRRAISTAHQYLKVKSQFLRMAMFTFGPRSQMVWKMEPSMSRHGIWHQLSVTYSAVFRSLPQLTLASSDQMIVWQSPAVVFCLTPIDGNEWFFFTPCVTENKNQGALQLLYLEQKKRKWHWKKSTSFLPDTSMCNLVLGWDKRKPW